MAQQKASSKKVVKKSVSAKKAAAHRPAKSAPTKKHKKVAPAPVAAAKAKGKTPPPRPAPAPTPTKKAVMKKMPQASVEQGRTPVVKKEKPAQPLSKADLNYFRNLLLEKRARVAGGCRLDGVGSFQGGVESFEHADPYGGCGHGQL